VVLLGFINEFVEMWTFEPLWTDTCATSGSAEPQNVRRNSIHGHPSTLVLYAHSIRYCHAHLYVQWPWYQSDAFDRLETDSVTQPRTIARSRNLSSSGKLDRIQRCRGCLQPMLSARSLLQSTSQEMSLRRLKCAAAGERCTTIRNMGSAIIIVSSCGDTTSPE